MASRDNTSGKKASASTKPLWQKLFIKGGTVALIAAPAGYDKLFTGSTAKVSTRGSGSADTVVLFAKDMPHLAAALPSAIERLAPAGTLWVAYRKGDKQFHRDTIWKTVLEYGYTGVSLVAVDETWSAMRLKKA